MEDSPTLLRKTSEGLEYFSDMGSVNTLASFLVGSRTPLTEQNHPTHSKEELEQRRQQRLEARVTANALNQFIVQAGQIYNGKRLNSMEERRLRDEANKVGLSLEVVDALIKHTADPNAMVKNCVASDDAFARKMKADPYLSRLLQSGKSPFDKTSRFDVSSSIWRVFMHKIVQQFLADRNLELSDVMKKELLSHRMHEEASRDEAQRRMEYQFKYNDYVNSPGGLAGVPRDYTKERQGVAIDPEDADIARQAAEASMGFASHIPFQDMVNGDGEKLYITRGENFESRDDDLSLCPPGMPGIIRSNDQSDHREETTPPTQKRQLGDGEKPVSAVKRALAFFEGGGESSTKKSDPTICKTPTRIKGQIDVFSNAKKRFEESDQADIDKQDHSFNGPLESNSQDIIAAGEKLRRLFRRSRGGEDEMDSVARMQLIPGEIVELEAYHNFETGFNSEIERERIQTPGKLDMAAKQLFADDEVRRRINNAIDRPSLSGLDGNVQCHSQRIDDAVHQALLLSEATSNETSVGASRLLSANTTMEDSDYPRTSDDSCLSKKRGRPKTVALAPTDESDNIEEFDAGEPSKWDRFSEGQLRRAGDFALKNEWDEISPINSTHPVNAKERSHDSNMHSRRQGRRNIVVGPVRDNSAQKASTPANRWKERSILKELSSLDTPRKQATPQNVPRNQASFHSPDRLEGTAQGSLRHHLEEGHRRGKGLQEDENDSNQHPFSRSPSLDPTDCHRKQDEADSPSTPQPQVGSSATTNGGSKQVTSWFNKKRQVIEYDHDCKETQREKKSQQGGEWELFSNNNFDRSENERIYNTKDQPPTSILLSDNESQSELSISSAREKFKQKILQDHFAMVGVKPNSAGANFPKNRHRSKCSGAHDEYAAIAKVASGNDSDSNVSLNPLYTEPTQTMSSGSDSRIRGHRSTKDNQGFRAFNSETIFGTEASRLIQEEPYGRQPGKPSYCEKSIASPPAAQPCDHSFTRNEQISRKAPQIMPPGYRVTSHTHIDPDASRKSQLGAEPLKENHKSHVQSGSGDWDTSARASKPPSRSPGLEPSEDFVANFYDAEDNSDKATYHKQKKELNSSTSLQSFDRCFASTSLSSNGGNSDRRPEQAELSCDIAENKRSQFANQCSQDETQRSNEYRTTNEYSLWRRKHGIDDSTPNETATKGEEDIEDQGSSLSGIMASSSETESELDEDEIRAVAKANGIPAEVVEVILSQKRMSQQKRLAKKETREKTPVLTQQPQHVAPIDSDTCLPASTRHLRKEVGPSPSNMNMPKTWGSPARPPRLSPSHIDSPTTHHPEDTGTPVVNNCRAEPWPETEQYPNEMPEGATEEEINLLNRFIEVAASNFNGKKLSADSERRVRAAAVKVGLSDMFVDQILLQAQGEKLPPPCEVTLPLSTVGGADGEFDFPSSPGETRSAWSSNDRTTTHTRKRDRKKDRFEPPGCQVWDNFVSNLKYWTGCAGEGDDDGSTASSPASVAWDDENQNNKRRRTKIRAEV